MGGLNFVKQVVKLFLAKLEFFYILTHLCTFRIQSDSSQLQADCDKVLLVFNPLYTLESFVLRFPCSSGFMFALCSVGPLSACLHIEKRLCLPPDGRHQLRLPDGLQTRGTWHRPVL